MSHDQAAQLRRMAAHRALPREVRSRGASLVAIGGIAGGTSAVAFGVAAALVRLGRRVVLVDADFDSAEITRRVVSHTHGTLQDVFAQESGIHEVLTLGPAGVQILPGQSATQPIAPRAIADFAAQLAELAPHVELVVADVGHLDRAAAQRLWMAADVRWLVYTPQDETVLESYRVLKRVSAVDNRSLSPVAAFICDAPAQQADVVQQRLALAGRRFLRLDVEAAGYTPSPLVDWQVLELIEHPTLSTAFETAAERLYHSLHSTRRNRSAGRIAAIC